MNAFAGDFLFYALFVGLYQALFAAGVAGFVLPFLARATQIRYSSLLGRFALLNVFLLVWGGFGDSLWLHCTVHRLSVADNAPVWAPFVPFVPFGRWVLDSATGWRGGWELHEGTTIGQLQWLWAAITLPVWIASLLSVAATRVLIARFAPHTCKTQVG